MEGLETERQAKKAFLRQEVVEQGYEPDVFTEFIEKERGADVDIWTIEELKDCVERFKRSLKQRESDSGDSYQTGLGRAMQETEEIKTTKEVSQSLPSPKTPGTPHSPANKPAISLSPAPDASRGPRTAVDPSFLPPPEMLTCSEISSLMLTEPAYALPSAPLPHTELSMTENVTISLGKYSLFRTEIASGSLLTSGYVNFVIVTEPFSWTVKRKFTDFQWLKEALEAQFPGYFVLSNQVPPLPPKKSTGLASSDTVTKRTAFLTRFLHTLAATPLFLHSPYLLAFLKETSNDHFSKIQKTTKRLKRPDFVQEQPSLSDTVMCSSPVLTDHFSVISDFLAATELLKKKLKRQSESLIFALNSLSKELESFAETLKSLSDLQDVATRTDTMRWNYGSFASAMFQWSKHEAELAELCKDNLNLFFKYRYSETAELKEVLKEREARLQIYLRAAERLEGRKSKLWAQGDAGKWMLSAADLLQLSFLRSDKAQAFAKMLPAETMTVKSLQDTYGYFNYLAKAEIYRLVTYSNDTETHHFAEFSSLVEHCLQSLALEWRTFTSTLSSSH